jgi:hypothetical protein
MFLHAALWAILIYVSLDLSLPMMPGAFVFDPGESVESARLSHERKPAGAIVLREPVGVPAPVSRLAEIRPRPTSPSDGTPRGPVLVRSSARASAEPPTSSDEPH